MPQATAADNELLKGINPVIRKFPIMTSTPKGEAPRSGSDCVMLMVDNMNQITVYRNYIEQRNRQRDNILQILGIELTDIYSVSAIRYFFSMKDSEYKDAVKKLDDEVKSLHLALNSLLFAVTTFIISSLLFSKLVSSVGIDPVNCFPLQSFINNAAIIINTSATIYGVTCLNVRFFILFI